MTTELGEGLSIVYEPHAKQAEVHASSARFRVVIKGRQSGGTLLAVVEIVQYALSHPGANLWWLTSSYSVKDKAWRELMRVIPSKVIRKKHEGELYITLRNGSRIQIRSADAPDALISETLAGIVCDEFSYYRDDVWSRHIEPMLATTHGWALFTGTPYGHNWAHSLYLHALSSDPEWAAFRWPSYESPYFSMAQYNALKLTTPERVFAQEYAAEFVSGSGAVFRNIDACIGPLGKANDDLGLGIDFARVKDFTVIYALNGRRQTVEIQRFNRLDWGLQKTRIVETYRRLKARKAICDATGIGDPLVSDLRRSGLLVEAVSLTSERKAEIIEHLMVLLDQGLVRIPNDETLLGELRAFSFETLPSGRDRYEGPSGETRRPSHWVSSCGLRTARVAAPVDRAAART